VNVDSIYSCFVFRAWCVVVNVGVQKILMYILHRVVVREGVCCGCVPRAVAPSKQCVLGDRKDIPVGQVGNIFLL